MVYIMSDIHGRKDCFDDILKQKGHDNNGRKNKRTQEKNTHSI